MKKLVLALMMCFILTCSPVFAAAAADVMDRWDTNEQVVAITCENVDNVAQVENILKLCREEGVQITLFMRGSLMPNMGAIVKKAAAESLEIGNYGLERVYWSGIDSQIITKELNEAGAIAKSYTSQSPLVIRPPFSYYDANFLEAAAAYSSSAIVVRGIDTGDWTLMSPQAVVDKVVNSVTAGDIINIHMKNQHAVNALPEIIKQLKAKGLQITTVSTLKSKSKTKPLTVKIPQVATRDYAVISHLNGSKPYIALTFDDGGGYYRANEILDILKEYDIKSTFFLLGSWAEANPEVTRRIAAEGHEIANHSYSHPRFTWLSATEMQDEILAAQRTVEAITGHSITPLFRPPYGEYNGTVNSVLQNLGYQALVMWDVDSRDWTGVSAWSMSRNILSQISEGAIVLFHLHGRNTPDALREIVPTLRAQGYQLSTVGTMFNQ